MKQTFLALAMIGMVALWTACGSSGGTNLLPGINGCTSFTDATAPGASRTINFGGNFGNTYDQKCLAVAVNQQVTWTGSFSLHPLRPGLAPSQSGGPDAGSPNNPILATTSGNGANFTFTAAGTYPYYCSVHENVGMFGAVQVR
jgi:plastocyanin